MTGYYSTLSLYSHPNAAALTAQSESVDLGGHRFIRYRADDAGQWGALVRSVTSLMYITARAACDHLGYQSDGPLERWLAQYRPARPPA